MLIVTDVMARGIDVSQVYALNSHAKICFSCTNRYVLLQIGISLDVKRSALNVLIVTDVMARGIDVSQVCTLISELWCLNLRNPKRTLVFHNVWACP